MKDRAQEAATFPTENPARISCDVAFFEQEGRTSEQPTHNKPNQHKLTKQKLTDRLNTSRAPPVHIVTYSLVPGGACSQAPHALPDPLTDELHHLGPQAPRAQAVEQRTELRARCTGAHRRQRRQEALAGRAQQTLASGDWGCGCDFIDVTSVSVRRHGRKKI